MPIWIRPMQIGTVLYQLHAHVFFFFLFSIKFKYLKFTIPYQVNNDTFAYDEKEIIVIWHCYEEKYFYRVLLILQLV
jgi:hypothetical protein